MATGTAPAAATHPDAPAHLPGFITAPGEGDWLLAGAGIFLLLAVIGVGVFYLKLHALPEHMAHRGQKLQYEIVAVLALIALFTHNNAFWIAALLLAMIPIPDISTPLASMARSLGVIAAPRDGAPPGEPTESPPRADPPEAGPDEPRAAQAGA